MGKKWLITLFIFVVIICSVIFIKYFYGCRGENCGEPRQEKCFGNIMQHKEVCKEGKCKIVIADNATCIKIDENKNKLTVIIKKDGIYDTDRIKNKISEYFLAVKNDLAVDNVEISYFSGKTIDDMNTFTENLFCEKNVGYIIIVGDDLINLIGTGAENIMKYALVGEKENFSNSGEYIPKDSNVIPEDSFCKDIGISVVMPPVDYLEEDKIYFVVKAFENFSNYHNKSILSQYKGQIHIKWDPNVIQDGIDTTNVYTDYTVYNNTEVVFNSQHNKVAEELGKKYYLFTSLVHGAPNNIGIGLKSTPANDDNYVYTNLEEFREFFSKSSSHPLIFALEACNLQWLSYQGVPNCCWPQAFIEAGAWVQLYLGATGGGNQPEAFIDEEITENEKFIGYFIRHEKIDSQYFIAGDITAYLTEQAHKKRD